MLEISKELKSLLTSEPWWKRIVLFVPWLLLLVLAVVVWSVWVGADKAERAINKARKKRYEKTQADLAAEKKGVQNEIEKTDKGIVDADESATGELSGIDSAVDNSDWAGLDSVINRVWPDTRGESND